MNVDALTRGSPEVTSRTMLAIGFSAKLSPSPMLRGTLILGIEETEDEPPRAATVRAVPRVHDLAMRLEEAAHACIEPRLPALQVRGVVTDDAGGGVLIFRVSPSPVGPHRVNSDGHAYIRRGARTVKMTMREIQDLTLDLARGAERIDALFTGPPHSRIGCSIPRRENEAVIALLLCRSHRCRRYKGLCSRRPPVAIA